MRNLKSTCQNRKSFYLDLRLFSIVLATTAGRSETLKKCLASIFANDYPQEKFEVIVIDSGIDDRGLSVIEDFKKQYPNLRFYSPGWGNVGPAKARNLGIKKAQNEIVAFTDDDCLVPKDWLKSFADGYRRHPEVAGVGGYLEAPPEVLRANVFAQYERHHEWSQYGIKEHEFVSKKRNEAPFETNNISYRRKVLEEVGGFDEDYSLVGSGEDGDLKERVLELGYRLLFIPVKVIHLQEYSLRRFLRQQISRGGGILVHKRKSGRSERRFEIILKALFAPIVFFNRLIVGRFGLDFAVIEALGFGARQLGKLKYFGFEGPTLSKVGPLKILFVDHTPFVGGAELVLISHIRQLTKSTRKRSRSSEKLFFKPFVACSDSVPKLIKNYKDAGAKVLVIPFDKLKVFDWRVFWRLFRSVTELSSVIRREKIDLVITNTERAMYAATVAALLNRTALIWWIRDFEYNRLFFRLLSFAPKKIICVSNVVRKFYGGEGSGKFEVVYVASDFDEKLRNVAESDLAAVRKELGIGDNDFVIGFVGRLVKWKGAQVLLKAARKLKVQPRKRTSSLRGRSSKFKVVVVGSGEGQEGNIEPRLREMIEDYGLADRVILTGQRDDVPVLMKIFDIFCHTSIEPEPFATVVVEAMLAGVPVVGTSIGGTPEVIKDGENGFLVPPDDPEALADILKHLCEDESLRRRIGAAAKETALASYTEAVVTRRVEKIYKGVLE